MTPVQNNVICGEYLFLTEEEASKKAYIDMISRTARDIAESIGDEKAYIGLSPQELKEKIKVEQILPERGRGLSSVSSLLSEKILPYFLRTPSTDYMAHLHGPSLLETVAAELVLSTFNQSMDSWDQSPVATEIEVEVIGCLCALSITKEEIKTFLSIFEKVVMEIDAGAK